MFRVIQPLLVRHRPYVYSSLDHYEWEELTVAWKSLEDKTTGLFATTNLEVGTLIPICGFGWTSGETAPETLTSEIGKFKKLIKQQDSLVLNRADRASSFPDSKVIVVDSSIAPWYNLAMIPIGTKGLGIAGHVFYSPDGNVSLLSVSSIQGQRLFLFVISDVKAWEEVSLITGQLESKIVAGLVPDKRKLVDAIDRQPLWSASIDASLSPDLILSETLSHPLLPSMDSVFFRPVWPQSLWKRAMRMTLPELVNRADRQASQFLKSHSGEWKSVPNFHLVSDLDQADIVHDQLFRSPVDLLSMAELIRLIREMPLGPTDLKTWNDAITELESESKRVQKSRSSDKRPKHDLHSQILLATETQRSSVLNQMEKACRTKDQKLVKTLPLLLQPMHPVWFNNQWATQQGKAPLFMWTMDRHVAIAPNLLDAPETLAYPLVPSVQEPMDHVRKQIEWQLNGWGHWYFSRLTKADDFLPSRLCLQDQIAQFNLAKKNLALSAEELHFHSKLPQDSVEQILSGLIEESTHIMVAAAPVENWRGPTRNLQIVAFALVSNDSSQKSARIRLFCVAPEGALLPGSPALVAQETRAQVDSLFYKYAEKKLETLGADIISLDSTSSTVFKWYERGFRSNPDTGPCVPSSSQPLAKRLATER